MCDNFRVSKLGKEGFGDLDLKVVEAEDVFSRTISRDDLLPGWHSRNASTLKWLLLLNFLCKFMICDINLCLLKQVTCVERGLYTFAFIFIIADPRLNHIVGQYFGFLWSREFWHA